MTLGAFAVSASVKFFGNLPLGGGEYEANVTFEGKRKQRIGANGPDTVAILSQGIVDGEMTEILKGAILNQGCFQETHELPVFLAGAISEFSLGWEYRSATTDFGFVHVFLYDVVEDEQASYQYGHRVIKRPQTINNVFSNYWLQYYVDTGIFAWFSSDGQPTDSGGGLTGRAYVSLRSRNATSTNVVTSNTTGQSVEIDITTPEGSIPLNLTDCSIASNFASNFSSNFLSTWVEYPTFSFDPSPP